jgi:hypothetical protein
MERKFSGLQSQPLNQTFLMVFIHLPTCPSILRCYFGLSKCTTRSFRYRSSARYTFIHSERKVSCIVEWIVNHIRFEVPINGCHFLYVLFSNYDFKKNTRVIDFFNNFDNYISEESLWQISETIKPRGSAQRKLS